MQTDISLMLGCMLVIGGVSWWLLRMALQINELGDQLDDTDEYEPLEVVKDDKGRLVIVEED